VVILSVATLAFGFAAWLRPPLHGGYGTRDVRPADASAIEGSYQLAAGRLHIDLGRVDLREHSRAFTASLGIGRLEIIVPDTATVTFSGHVRGGEICAFGLRDGGTDINREVTSRAAGGTLRVPGSESGAFSSHGTRSGEP
jgi:hypothetical protein